MGDVKWIKLSVNMFEDEKIDFIESLPEGDAILNIWVRLLTMAGKCNCNGYIFITESIPYTPETLAHKFRKQINIVTLALQTFQKLGMIQIDEQGIYITNWNKYQSTDRLEEIKEQNRLRQQRFRERQKALTAGLKEESTKEENIIDLDIEYRAKTLRNNVTSNVTDNATKKDPKIAYAEFVKMTEAEYEKLVTKYGKSMVDKMIEKLDNYKGAHGKKYKSDYRAILNWVADEVMKEQNVPKAVNEPTYKKLF